MISTLALNCTADTFINRARPNENFGNYNIFWVGRKNSNTIYRSLIKFSLSAIPADATILSAKLRLYADIAENSLITEQLTSFLISESWTESTATWNNSPAFDPGIFGGTVPVSTIGSYELDVTSIVQAWFSGARNNNGILLKSAENQNNENKRFIGCKASKCSQVFLRPVLILQVKSLDSSNVVLVGREYTETSQTVITSNVFQCIAGQNTSQFTLVTFFVKNNGFFPANVRLEISPDNVNYVLDDIDFTVGPGELKALIPMKFGKFTRVCYKSANIGLGTNLSIQMQAHV